MAGAQITLASGEAIRPEHVDQILKVHASTRLHLATTVGANGFMHLNGSGFAMVTEILRLARLGALAEEAAKTDPTLRVSHVAKAADAVWRLDRGR